MAGSFMTASFNPPAADDASPTSYPFSVLLDSRAYLADRHNATTLQARASTGHDFEVTFCLADPPAVSYFCVHCPRISIQEVCTTEPRVVSSANDLVLLCFAFKTNSPSTDKDSHHLEYFVYKAAPGGKHTIRPVPCSPPAYKHSWHAAIVPREGGNFLVADLSPNGEDLGHYNLHIFSSETNEWSTKHVRLKESANVLPLDLPSQTDKVISLGVSTVGWVDLWRGIVVCDVLQKDPVLCFLPLPKASYKVHREIKVWPVRDVTVSPDGLINFIEIEHCSKWAMFIHLRSFKTTTFLDYVDIISDSDILGHHEMDFLKNGIKSVPDGWRIRTCFRSISWDHWRKGHTVHVDDMSADPQHAVLLPNLWDSRTEKCILRNLKTTPGFPTFCIYRSDVVYLMSKVGDKDTWMLCVDLGKKSLEVVKPYCASRATYLDETFRNTFISCAFSKYLNTTPSPRPYDAEVAAESAQSVALNDHLSLGDTALLENPAKHGEWRYDGAHPGYYGKYQRPTLFQPPSLKQTGQPMSSSTSTQLVPSSEMCNPPTDASNTQPLAPRRFFINDLRLCSTKSNIITGSHFHLLHMASRWNIMVDVLECQQSASRCCASCVHIPATTVCYRIMDDAVKHLNTL